MKIRYYISFSSVILFLCIGIDAISQYDIEIQKQINKFKKSTETSKDDSVKVVSLIEWDNLIYLEDPELDRELNERMISICGKALKKKQSKSRKNFFTEKMAYANNGLAIIASDKSDFKSSIHHYTLALQLYEKSGNEKGIATVCTNMSGIYGHMEMYDKSMELLLRSKEIALRLDDERNLTFIYNNLGNAYLNLDDFESAEKSHLECLRLSKKLGLADHEGSVENNLGNIHAHFAEQHLENNDEVNARIEYDKALAHYKNGMRIHDSLGNRGGAAMAMMNYADILYKTGRIKEAEPKALKAFEIVKELNYPEETRQCANILYMIYKLQGKTGPALAMHELYIELKDSLINEENKLEILRKEAQYEYDKKRTKTA